MSKLEGGGDNPDSPVVNRRTVLGFLATLPFSTAACGGPEEPDPSVTVIKGPRGSADSGHPGFDANGSTDATMHDADVIAEDFGERVNDATRVDEDADEPALDEGLPPEDFGEPVPDEGLPPEDVSGDVPAEEDISPVDPDDGVPADEGQPQPDEGQPTPDIEPPPEDVETFAPMEIVVTAQGYNLENGAEILLANFWIDVTTEDSGTINSLTFNITPENWPQFYGINVYLADANYEALTPFQTIGKPGDSDKTLPVTFQLPQTPIQTGKTLIRVMIKSLSSVPKAQDNLMQIITNLAAAEIESAKSENQEVQTNFDNAVAVSTNQFNT